MKSIVFLGTSAFAVPTLRALAQQKDLRVFAVLTQPDRPAGRSQKLSPPPVKLAAEELALPVLQPESLRTEFTDISKAIARPDFLVVVSYGQILSPEVLAWPTICPVNVHASLLPKLRGASPIQYAILEDLKETGVTVQRMVSKLDAGPILSQAKKALDPRETFETLHDALAEAGALLLTTTLLNPLVPVDQDESEATVCGKLQKSDGFADPSATTAVVIDRMVRALTPWPGVTWDGNKILATSLHEAEGSMPLPCAEGTVLHILRIQPPGKKPMSGADFLRGRPR